MRYYIKDKARHWRLGDIIWGARGIRESRGFISLQQYQKRDNCVTITEKRLYWLILSFKKTYEDYAVITDKGTTDVSKDDNLYIVISR